MIRSFVTAAVVVAGFAAVTAFGQAPAPTGDKINLLRDAGDRGNWQVEAHEGAAVEGTAIPGGIKIQVTQAGTADWHVQVYQGQLPLEEGQEYVLHFKARSDAPRQYHCYFGSAVPDYHAVSPSFTVDTTTEWKSFSFPFKASKVGEAQSRGPLFPMGLQVGTLELAEVALDGTRPEAKGFAMPAGWFEVPMHWDDALMGTATDVSFLNEKPAGKNGYIVARDGHFYEEKTGKRVRFWGTNLGAGEAFPEKADADMFAKRLAKAGVNIVRLHHMDNPWAIQSAGSIWDPSRPDHQQFNPVTLDRLDYLVNQLKVNGIYVNINLKVSKELSPADGFPESVNDITKAKFTHQKRVDYFQKRMVELQKDYARKLLGHKNPYTGMTYADDPAVAVVEINNENSLVGYWTQTLGKDLEKLPEPFRSELQGMWNDWLKKKYGSDAKLAAAWMEGVTAEGPSILNSGMGWSSENHDQTKVVLNANPGKADAAPNAALDIQNVDATSWHVQAHVSGLTLKEGGTYTISFRAKADKARPMTVEMRKDIEDWHNMGLMQNVDLTPEFKEYSYSFKATQTTPEHVRIGFTIGQQAGKIWIEDLRLAPGAKGLGLQKGETLAQGNIAMPRSGTDRQWADWIHFLADTERDYSDQMRAVLKDELKIHANVALTQVDYGGTTGLNREARMEFADTHAYWQHPNFANGDWNPNNWKIENTPQVMAFAERKFGELGNLALTRVAGKPFSVSEYDHPAPSDYAGEMMPEFASFAALQDWDVLYTFAVADYSSKVKPDRIMGYFDQNNHPAKWLENPTAALIFRQALITPAPAVATIELPAPIWESYHFAPRAWDALVPNGPFGFTTRRVQISDKPLPAGEKPRLVEKGTPAPTQVRVEKAGDKQVYLAGAPGTVVFCGYVGGQALKAGDAQLVTDSFGNNFATVTATATDGQPIASSKRVLVTVVGRVENKAMGWNPQRTTVGSKWGFGPSIAEHVPAKLTLPVDGARKVYALDSTGKRVKQVQAAVEGGKVTIAPKTADAALLYEVVAE